MLPKAGHICLRRNPYRDTLIYTVRPIARATELVDAIHDAKVDKLFYVSDQAVRPTLLGNDHCAHDLVQEVERLYAAKEWIK